MLYNNITNIIMTHAHIYTGIDNLFIVREGDRVRSVLSSGGLVSSLHYTHH